MSLRSDLVYVAHMRDAAGKVMRFTKGLIYEDFLENEEKQWAVIRGIEILGEASTKISAEFVDAHPEFPWKHMRGMRNVLIHNYADVDLLIVWTAIMEDLPNVDRLANAVLEREEAPQLDPDPRKENSIRHIPSWRRRPPMGKKGPELDR